MEFRRRRSAQPRRVLKPTARFYFSINTPLTDCVTIEIRFAQLEPNPLVQAVSSLTRWARGQVNCFGAQFGCAGQGRPGQDLTNALGALGLIHNHVLNPGPHAGGDAKGYQGERTDNPAALL